jgi:hypothetical protein
MDPRRLLIGGRVIAFSVRKPAVRGRKRGLARYSGYKLIQRACSSLAPRRGVGRNRIGIAEPLRRDEVRLDAGLWLPSKVLRFTCRL